jgi:hypothetical protein
LTSAVLSPVDILSSLPASYFNVAYEGEMVPGHRPDLGLSAGANCQRFATAVLRHLGLELPDLRSNELWLDDLATEVVAEPQPLDLVLYGAKPDPWGAHVGVCLGGSSVLHLCAEVGRPAVWDFTDFAARPRYRTRIGFKRVRPAGGPLTDDSQLP